ncbi:MAG TPA: histidinol-phosphate transaminase [Polyangiaceae bacterium]|jgi:histidinol-phosphate aminotransferase
MPLEDILRGELVDLAPYVPASHAGAAVRLDANEAPPPSSPAIRDAVTKAIARVALERYPDARALELKEAIAARTGAPVSSIVVGTGSDELIALLATACARPRGRMTQGTIVAPTPTFVMYRVTARAHGLRAVDVPLDAAWDLDLAAMEKALELMQPNVIFVASPNNPTGNRVSRDRLEALALAAQDTLVVIDEAYVDYAAEGSLRGLRETHPNVAILRTLSKVGLAALRVGWIEAGDSIARALDKARQPFNVSATSQAAAAAVLRDAWGAVREHVGGVVRERERVASAITATRGARALPSEANFIWVETEKAAGAVHEAMLARGVLVRSFHAAGGRMARHLRITIGTPAENDAMLAALAEGCA